MKKVLSFMIVAVPIFFASCDANKKNAIKEIESGGTVITRNGCNYIVIFKQSSGEIETVFHDGSCPNPEHNKTVIIK